MNNKKMLAFYNYFENESKRKEEKIELRQRQFFLLIVLLVIIGIVKELIRFF
ncbi:MAG: hypothetical protein VW333_12700 [Pseudomonadales bacterium]